MKNDWSRISMALLSKSVVFNTAMLLLSMSVSFATLAEVVLAQGSAPALVVVMPVVQRNVTASHTFVGTVHPQRRSLIGSAVDGRVQQMHVNEGDWVTAGQPLAQLLTETIKIELRAAQAEEQLREAELNELENGLRPEEILQAKAQLQRSQALLDYALARRKRTESLFQINRTASQEELDEANSVAEAAQQNQMAVEAAYQLAVKGPRAEKIAQAKARFLAQQEQVKLIESRIAKFTIRSPFDGYVVAEHTEVGQWISKADLVVEVIELDPVEISIAIPEKTIANITTDMPATVTFNALPGTTLQGTVVRIVPQANTRSRTFPVKIRVSNPRQDGRHLLKSGMLVQVTLTVGQQMNALLVPKDALVLGGPTPSVIVVVDDPKSKQKIPRFVPVKVGTSYGRLIQISGSIRAGEHVVVIGNERIRPGQPLKVQRVLPAESLPKGS